MTKPQPAPSTDPPPAERPPEGPEDEATPLYGPRFQEDPAEVYRQMRRKHGPVAPVLLDGDIPAWLVIGYREVHYVTGNPQLYGRDSRRWNAWHRIPADWPLLTLLGHQPSVMFAEGAEFQRRSAATGDALAAVDQLGVRSRCERVADGLIDRFADGGRADLIADYADPIPMLVIAGVCGMPDSEVPDLIRNMTIAAGSGPDAVEAVRRNRLKFQQVLDLRRAHPRTDVISRLVTHPIGITDEEIIEDLNVVLGSGQVPTAAWIGTTLRLMLTDDRFAVSLSGGRHSVGHAMNEVLWEDTPTQNMAGRFAVRDTWLAGRHIKAGDLLILGLAAANNDPLVRPDSFGGSGGNHAHMSFSYGEHRCPYPAQEIAEVIAATAVEVLLDRLPDVALAVPEDALEWRPSPWIRSLSALPVLFTPTHAAGPA